MLLHFKLVKNLYWRETLVMKNEETIGGTFLSRRANKYMLFRLDKDKRIIRFIKNARF